jgi:hypothetical protein
MIDDDALERRRRRERWQRIEHAMNWMMLFAAVSTVGCILMSIAITVMALHAIR